MLANLALLTGVVCAKYPVKWSLSANELKDTQEQVYVLIL
jgi:hypothetical protein